MKRAILVLMVVVVLAASLTSAETLYNIIDLGTLREDHTVSRAYGINNQGKIVGYSATANGGYYYGFLYENDSMSDLGHLHPAWQQTRAFAISDSSQVVGSSDLNAANAFLYENDQMSSLGTLSGGTSKAYDINNNGQIVGFSYDGSERRGFIYENDVMSDIGTLGQTFNSDTEAYAINDSGQIVGWSTVPRSNSPGYYSQHAFLYEDSLFTDLGHLGGYLSYAYDINNDGITVGESHTDLGQIHAFVYENNQMVDMGTLGGGWSWARAINSSGQIVGASDGHAFLYENGEMFDLGSGAAYGINDNGLIVGESSGHAVLWEPIPEPTTLLLLGLGAGMLSKRK